MNWYDRFATPAWDNWFRLCAKKKFGYNEDLEQEAYEYAIEKVYAWADKESDTAKQTDSYCRVVYKSKLIDIHRHYFKRFKPYKWVKDKGQPWPETAKLLYFGYMLEDIRTILQKDIGKDYSIDELRSIIEQLYQRPYGQLYPLDTGKNTTPSSETPLVENERYCFVRFLLGKTDDDNDDDMELPITVIKKWQALSEKLQLSDDERLVLKLRFYEGMSYWQIAGTLPMLVDPKAQVKTQEKVIERILKEIIAKIRALFAEEGIRFDDL